MDGAGLFFLLLLLLIILPAAGWIGYTRWRAHKQGLPAPPLSAYNPFNARSRSSANPFADSSSSGPLNWVKDKFNALKSGGSKGAYHGTGATHSRLDPDGAWDDRVGDEVDRYGGPGLAGDYEEQELGLHPGDQYGGAGYGGSRALPAYGEERGRARNRGDEGFIGGSQTGLDERYDEEVHGSRSNPFGEGAERSDLRGVSPRPMDDGPKHGKKASQDLKTGERRSVFHETL